MPVIDLDADTGSGERLDRFLARVLAGRVDGLSRSRIQQWISLGAVWSQDRTLSQSTRLFGSERLKVQPLPREADRAFEPDDVDLSIVQEDEHLLVIDKPAGLVVHPAPGHWRGTLLNGLLRHRPTLAALPRAGIVHRLDKDTSGLMVVAASELSLQALGAQIAARSMSRRYLAFVRGTPDEAGVVDAPVGRDLQVRTRMAVLHPPAGRPARTHYRRLASLRVDGVVTSLLECRLETGRTHQIRVHMRHIGHPLLGDTLYGGGTGFARQALHAWRLGLAYPVGGQPQHWVSVPPDDLRGLASQGAIDLVALCQELEEGIDE